MGSNQTHREWMSCELTTSLSSSFRTNNLQILTSSFTYEIILKLVISSRNNIYNSLNTGQFFLHVKLQQNQLLFFKFTYYIINHSLISLMFTINFEYLEKPFSYVTSWIVGWLSHTTSTLCVFGSIPFTKSHSFSSNLCCL